jgi:hypothetical protein
MGWDRQDARPIPPQSLWNLDAHQSDGMGKPSLPIMARLNVA